MEDLVREIGIDQSERERNYVNYCGWLLEAPTWTNYVAVCSRGGVWGFQDEPEWVGDDDVDWSVEDGDYPERVAYLGHLRYLPEGFDAKQSVRIC